MCNLMRAGFHLSCFSFFFFLDAMHGLWIGLVSTYGALPNRALDEFARRGIDADGAGAVDCVVCYDCLGEDV
jgi:hypothetical protein